MVGGDVSLRGRIAGGDLARQFGVVGAGGGERRVRRARVAPSGVGLSAGGPEPGLEHADELGLPVVGHLALADERDFELRLKALD